jgi:hypothetical protein
MHERDDEDDSLIRLIQAHPELFDCRAPTDSYLATGWYAIADKLCGDIEGELGRAPSLRVRVAQIRADLGVLRFSAFFDRVGDTCGGRIDAELSRSPVEVASTVTDDVLEECARKRISDLIRLAEDASAFACHECGDAGRRRTLGWRQTLCDKHFALAEAYVAELDRQDLK